MFYVVAYRKGTEQFGPFRTEDETLEYIGDNADRTWLGCDVIKLPGTIQAFRVEMIGTAFHIGFNEKTKKRVMESINRTEDVRKLIDMAKMLNVIQQEQETVQRLRDHIKARNSCEHCPAVGGGCIVCS